MDQSIYFIVRISIVFVLFGFVGWAIFTLWSEIHYRLQVATNIKNPKLFLFPSEMQPNHIISNPEGFTHTPIHIGRDKSCDICLQETTISARHARIQYHHKQWWIEDLHSSNGTYLNEIPVITPVVLKSNDHIRCGEIEIRVEIESL